MSTSQLIDRYTAGPQMLRQAVAGMSDEQIRARPIAGKWSTLEVVCHLADFEVIGVDRLTAVIAEDEPTIPGRDEQKFAARLLYERRDLEEQLRLIELCRGHVTRILRTLTTADWQRVGIHTEAGRLTLEQLLTRSVKHIEHHVPFIHEKRKALGK
jgi:DinB superfamily